MRSPNFNNLKDTSLIYELISQVINIVKKDFLIFNTTSELILTKDLVSTDNIFFSILNRLTNHNYKPESVKSLEIINTYLKSIRDVHHVGNIQQMEYLSGHPAIIPNN